MVLRRILGIDPGSRITGIGIIEQQAGSAPVCLYGESLQLPVGDIPTRLSRLFFEIQDIVKQFKPTELAIEQVFVQKNIQSALKIGQARGVAIAAAAVANLPMFEYAPRQIKQAVVGRGSADKNQIQHMIQILLTLPVKPPSDAADALAVALCHLHASSLNGLTPSSCYGLRRASQRGRGKRGRWMSL